MCQSFDVVYSVLDNALNNVLKWPMNCTVCYIGISAVCFYPFVELETTGYNEVGEDKSSNNIIRIQWHLSRDMH